MGRRVILQPNGNFAIFSSIVDAFVLLNATADEIVDEYVREHIKGAVRDATNALACARGEEPRIRLDSLKHASEWEEALDIMRRHDKPQKDIQEAIRYGAEPTNGERDNYDTLLHWRLRLLDGDVDAARLVTSLSVEGLHFDDIPPRHRRAVASFRAVDDSRQFAFAERAIANRVAR